MPNSETPCDTRAETPARDTRDPASGPALPGDLAERLNVAEWMVMQFGAVAVRLIEIWNPPTGPFFASDGRLIADATIFLPPDDDSPAI
jgi:hypothetical protein